MTKPNMADVLIAVRNILPKDGPLRIEQTKKRGGPLMAIDFVAPSHSPRPTLDEVKSAMIWWNSLSRDRRAAVRADMNAARGHSIGASEITRHWLTINEPGPETDPSTEDIQ